MRIYKCEWHGKTTHLQALNLTDAENRFEEKYGFFPSSELVTITATSLRTVK